MTTRYFTMHGENPQLRLINQAAEALHAGELVAYITDSGYALGCALNSNSGLIKLRRLRGLAEKHPLTLLCHSIAQASQYCLVNDQSFRIFKHYTPGPYTFILPATKKVPRLAQGLKRNVVGVRIPRNPIALALVNAMENPILSSTLWLAGDPTPLQDPSEIMHRTRGEVGVILDGGMGQENPSTVIDLVGPQPLIIRRGLGDPGPFEQ